MKILGECGIDHAIYNYIRWALPPGSFTTALLMLDRDRMEQSAHPLLKNGYGGNLLDEFFRIVEHHFPKSFTGTNFFTWKGYEKLDKDGQKYFLSELYKIIVQYELKGKEHPLKEVFLDLRDK